MIRVPAVVAALALLAAPAAAQDRGIFLFDFANDENASRVQMAEQVVEDAQDIGDAAVVLCAGSTGNRGRDQRREVMALLVEAGAARHRLLDAGTCTPQIAGSSRQAIGENRVWLALTTATFLERYQREAMGL